VALWGGLGSLGGRAAWGLGRRVGRGDELGGGLAAAFALFGREPVGGSLLVLGLAGGEGVVDAEVAGDQDGGGEQRDRASPISRHQPREVSLVAGSLMVEKVRSAAVRRL
jgi:hypothetical protein